MLKACEIVCDENSITGLFAAAVRLFTLMTSESTVFFNEVKVFCSDTVVSSREDNWELIDVNCVCIDEIITVSEDTLDCRLEICNKALFI